MSTSSDSVLETYVALKRLLAIYWSNQTKDLGLGVNQVGVLYRLLQSEATMGELCDIAQSDKGSMTRTIGSLVKLGLVKRRSDLHDGRITRIELTAKGRSIAQEAKKIRMSVEKKLDAALSQDERNQFLKLKEKIAKQIQES